MDEQLFDIAPRATLTYLNRSSCYVMIIFKLTCNYRIFNASNKKQIVSVFTY